MSETDSRVFGILAGNIHRPYVGITGGSYIPMNGDTYYFIEEIERQADIKRMLNPVVVRVR